MVKRVDIHLALETELSDEKVQDAIESWFLVTDVGVFNRAQDDINITNWKVRVLESPTHVELPPPTPGSETTALNVMAEVVGIINLHSDMDATLEYPGCVVISGLTEGVDAWFGDVNETWNASLTDSKTGDPIDHDHLGLLDTGVPTTSQNAQEIAEAIMRVVRAWRIVVHI